MVRFSVVFRSLLVGCWGLTMILVGSSEAQAAGKKLTPAQRKELIRQAKCVQKCNSRLYKKLLRRSGRGTWAKFARMKLWIRYGGCIAKCKAGWFCAGFKKSQKKCEPICRAADARKHKKLKGRRKRRRAKKARRACNFMCDIIRKKCGFKAKHKES